MAMELANTTPVCYEDIDQLLRVMPYESRLDFTKRFGERVMRAEDGSVPYGILVLQRAKKLGAEIEEEDLRKIVEYGLNLITEGYPPMGLHKLKIARELGADAAPIIDSPIVQAAVQTGYDWLKDDVFQHYGLDILAYARDIGFEIDENIAGPIVKKRQKEALFPLDDYRTPILDLYGLKRDWKNLMDFEDLEKVVSECSELMRDGKLDIERGLDVLSAIEHLGVSIDPDVVRASIETPETNVYDALKERKWRNPEDILWHLKTLGVKLDPTKLTDLVEQGYKKAAEYVTRDYYGLNLLIGLHNVGAELDKSRVAEIGYKALEFPRPDICALGFAQEIGAELDADRIANWGYDWVEKNLESGRVHEGLRALKIAKELGVEIDTNRIKDPASFKYVTLNILGLCSDLGVPVDTKLLTEVVKGLKDC